MRTPPSTCGSPRAAAATTSPMPFRPLAGERSPPARTERSSPPRSRAVSSARPSASTPTAPEPDMTTLTRRRFGASLAVLSAALGAPAAAQGGKPLYKDPKAPIPARVDDLLGRMTLEEKVAQLVGIWLKKEYIQTPDAEFSAERASKAFPHGLGQISRPSDRRGAKAGPHAGAEPGTINRTPLETARYINAAQKWAM